MIQLSQRFSYASKMQNLWAFASRIVTNGQTRLNIVILVLVIVLNWFQYNNWLSQVSLQSIIDYYKHDTK